jgi:hypothetical protein
MSDMIRNYNPWKEPTADELREQIMQVVSHTDNVKILQWILRYAISAVPKDE